MEDTRQSAMVLVTLNTNGITSVRSFPFLIDIGGSRVVQPDPENAAKIKDRINIP